MIQTAYNMFRESAITSFYTKMHAKDPKSTAMQAFRSYHIQLHSEVHLL